VSRTIEILGDDFGPYASWPPVTVRDGEDRQVIKRESRELHGTSNMEWGWPMAVFRRTALVGARPALFYEPLSSFEDVIRVLAIRSTLEESGIDTDLPSILVGFAAYESGYYAPAGLLPLPTHDDSFRGRHSVSVLGLSASEDLLIFQGSWGRNWGDEGLGYMSRVYFDDNVEAVFATWPTQSGLSPARIQSRCVTHLVSGDIASAWLTPNLFMARPLAIGTKVMNLVMWTTYSLETGGIVDIGELRTTAQIVGRVHVHHDVGSDGTESQVRELFVPVAHRRKSYGRVLLEYAIHAARQMESRRIAVWFWDLDEASGARPAAEAFAESMGLKWDGGPTKRPSIKGRASASVEPPSK
jgi:GNAT superfamily N-acetyltransferase